MDAVAGPHPHLNHSVLFQLVKVSEPPAWPRLLIGGAPHGGYKRAAGPHGLGRLAMQRAATHCGGRKHHRRAEAAAVVGAAVERATRERDVCAARVGAGGGADRKDDQPWVMPTVSAGNVRRGKVGEDGGLRVGRELLAVGAHRDLEVAVRRADRAVRPCDRRRQLGWRERLLHRGRHRVGGEALHGGRAAIDEAAAARRAAPRLE